MRSKAVHKWMTNSMEQLTLKLERYKPTGSGYNRIQPMLLSRSVVHMLNNPLPVADQIGNAAQHRQQQQSSGSVRSRGVLSRSESEWEEVYPAVKYSYSRRNSHETGTASDETTNKFTFYRHCSTRIT